MTVRVMNNRGSHRDTSKHTADIQRMNHIKQSEYKHVIFILKCFSASLQFLGRQRMDGLYCNVLLQPWDKMTLITNTTFLMWKSAATRATGGCFLMVTELLFVGHSPAVKICEFSDLQRNDQLLSVADVWRVHCTSEALQSLCLPNP